MLRCRITHTHQRRVSISQHWNTTVLHLRCKDEGGQKLFLLPPLNCFNTKPRKRKYMPLAREKASESPSPQDLGFLFAGSFCTRGKWQACGGREIFLQGLPQIQFWRRNHSLGRQKRYISLYFHSKCPMCFHLNVIIFLRGVDFNLDLLFNQYTIITPRW